MFSQHAAHLPGHLLQFSLQFPKFVLDFPRSTEINLSASIFVRRMFADLCFQRPFLRLQNILPLNPQGLGPVISHLAFNTAVSFTTNTNWQNYGGESTLSYLTQMLGLTVQNFVSAATGMAVLAAMIRKIYNPQF